MKARGIGSGDTVAAMLPNVPAMYEAHFGVAMAGAVLNTLNTRLDAEAIGFMLDHADAKVLLTDREFSTTVEKALARAKRRPFVIDVDDASYQGGTRLGEIEYEDFIARGDAAFEWSLPQDEWDAISLNYTSGTTGNPERRRLSPSRRLSQCAFEYRELGHAAAPGVLVDAADVPLQWLVLYVDRRSRRGDQYLSAQGRRRRGVRSHTQAPRYALLRRADRAQHAHQRA